MCAAKRTPRPTLQLVAKHLYRRGNSYEFRKVIPPQARPAFGVGTFSRSLGDVSRREADHAAAAYRLHCDKLIAEATRQPDPTEGTTRLRLPWHVPERDEIDRVVRAWVLEEVERDSAVTGRERTAKQRIRELIQLAEILPAHLREDRQGSLLTTTWIAKALRAEQGWMMPTREALFQYLLDRVGRAQREAAGRIRAELSYDDRPSPTHSMFEPTAFERDRVELAPRAQRAVPFMDMFAGYCAEQEPAAKTVKKWRVALNSLKDHLGHDDAARVTADDVIRWKNALLAPEQDGTRARGQGTVRNGYIGGVKPVFGWAVANKLIPTNPVAGVTVRVPKRTINRNERGYTRSEAKIVLKAAFATCYSGEDDYGAFARRWLPWLCAYSGARVTEMAQLRRIDVVQDSDGIWYVAVLPSAGSVKGRQARHVVIHPHLIEQGFLDAVREKDGPLFFDPRRKQAGSNGNSQAQKVGQRVADWVRSLGLDDPELQPNHGWRHTFVTIAREIGMDADVRQAITGHAERTEHQKYGNVTLRSMANWLAKFPRFAFS